MEHADVVVVGGRLAGCAVAAPLARAGRRVVVLDKMAFPSDQLSTHLLMPSGSSELSLMGALPRIMRHCNPSLVRYVQVEAEGMGCLERMRPEPNGIDFGVCIPRDLQDVCLVEAAREQGADVREHCRFESLRWRAGRVSAVRYVDQDGVPREIGATLVVGADGRRSGVAAAVGAYTPYRRSRNGRGLVFRYVRDPRAGTSDAETYFQWRDGLSFGFAFPSAPKGTLLILFMGHRDESSEARADPDAYWRRKLDEHPGLRARICGVDESTYTKLRSTGQTPAYFRASSGPGWALAGDAGHFKDPVTGQGMRDAMWMGRTLAEHVQPVLDDPVAVDRATREWEAERDRHCLHAYHFANLDTRVEVQSPVLCDIVRSAGRTTEPDLVDLFGRARTLQQILPLPRLAKGLVSALVRGDRPRSETIARALPELRTMLEVRRERFRDDFRATALVTGSDHPGAEFPPAPPLRSVSDEPVAVHEPGDPDSAVSPAEERKLVAL